MGELLASDQDIYRDILRLILSGEDHRAVAHRLIDARFVEQSVDFFKSIVDAKLNHTDITTDWYKENLILNPNLSKSDAAVNAGINEKSITNKRQSASREIVLEEASESYDAFLATLDDLLGEEINLDLNITYNGGTAHLSLYENIMIINALAVRRATIRGAMWSALGKNIETPLMLCLCKIFNVPDKHYSVKDKIMGGLREVDFYLIDAACKQINCEIKLQGKGNPEGADSVFARDSGVFVGGKLSDTNKVQLDKKGILWVELQTKNGFMKFGDVLQQLGIPHKEVDSNESIENHIDDVLCEIKSKQ